MINLKIEFIKTLNNQIAEFSIDPWPFDGEQWKNIDSRDPDRDSLGHTPRSSIDTFYNEAQKQGITDTDLLSELENAVRKYPGYLFRFVPQKR